MRLNSKGQVTIPRQFRDLAGIEPGSEVALAIENGRIIITRKEKASMAGKRPRRVTVLAALDRLAGSGDPALDGVAVMKLTRDRGRPHP